MDYNFLDKTSKLDNLLDYGKMDKHNPNKKKIPTRFQSTANAMAALGSGGSKNKDLKDQVNKPLALGEVIEDSLNEKDTSYKNENSLDSDDEFSNST